MQQHKSLKLSLRQQEKSKTKDSDILAENIVTDDKVKALKKQNSRVVFQYFATTNSELSSARDDQPRPDNIGSLD